MVRLHPRWQRARELVASGRLGRLSTAHGHFSYFNDDPDNVRNRAGIGGGGLLDIGFYPVTMSRFVFGEEPREVMARWDVDPRFGVDRLVTGVLSFSFGPVTFTAGTQTVAHQTFTVFGSDACLHVPMAWTFPDDRPSPLILERGPTPLERETETVETAPLHQWRHLVEAFARAVRLGTPAPIPLEDALANMRVLDALARSCETGRVERP
jgi:predicted dehydrogenase